MAMSRNTPFQNFVVLFSHLKTNPAAAAPAADMATSAGLGIRLEGLLSECKQKWLLRFDVTAGQYTRDTGSCLTFNLETWRRGGGNWWGGVVFCVPGTGAASHCGILQHHITQSYGLLALL